MAATYLLCDLGQAPTLPEPQCAHLFSENNESAHHNAGLLRVTPALSLVSVNALALT